MNNGKVESSETKVTGKQILSECVTLAGHIGAYLSDAFKQLWSDTKALFSRNDKKS